jgi:YHS domain-containing protein
METFMIRKTYFFAGLGALAITAALVGCNQSTSPPDQAAVKQPAAADPEHGAGKGDEEHGHKPGAHGGIIVSLGRDSYHAEAVFEKGGVVRLYMLGKDEARIQEVDAQELTAYVKAAGATEAETVKFAPAPQQGDAKGKTSQFTAKLPQELQGQVVEVTINNIRVGDERFRIGFSNESVAHGEAGMPAKKTSDEEVKLYLTPGGKYTEADIKANGNMTASQKFKGLRAEHDLKPKSGDKICPVTLTKANPKFSWVVGGKTYEFCCPPCVDEFVAQAKETPEEVKPPESYVKE